MSRTLRSDFPLHLVLGLVAILTFYPFVFLVITSFKSSPQFIHDFWGVAWPPTFANYRDAWGRISVYLLNSIIVSGISMVGVLALASIAGFVFARYNFPGREILFFAVLSLLMIPSVLTLVPAFLLVKSFGLLNTYWALIMPYIAGGQIFAIFILRSFIASLPEEMFEAARLDGASTMQAFRHIALPLSKPILVTIAIMNILGTWNDYIWPLVTTPDGKLWTISVGIVTFSNSFRGLENWGPMFAGFVIASIPLIVLFVFIAGLTSGAIKA
ncbi:MAG TPA: carbohydrate ABC transporter permease [Caldilineaceae bacterium]|nr:carbohydrate ABC transporter permease [Caldilineaceae bacterium]